MHQIFKKSMLGFTLIESLVYLALFSTVFLSVVLSAFYLSVGAQNVSAKTALGQEMEFLAGKVSWLVSEDFSIQLPQAGQASDKLVLVRSGLMGEVYLESGKLLFREGVSPPVVLNADSFVLRGLEFFLFEDLSRLKTTIRLSDNFSNTLELSFSRFLK